MLTLQVCIDHTSTCLYMVAVIAGASGALTGALLVYCVKIGKKMAVILWVPSFLAIFPLLGFFFVCPNVDIAGINTDYSNRYTKAYSTC